MLFFAVHSSTGNLIPVIKFCIIIICMMLMPVIGVVPLYWLNWSLYATGCQICFFLMVACLHTTMCVTWFRILHCRYFLFYFYRQDAAKWQTVGIKFTHRPKIRFWPWQALSDSGQSPLPWSIAPRSEAPCFWPPRSNAPSPPPSWNAICGQKPKVK